MSKHDIREIYQSMVNGQRKQAVTQIDEYGPEFWADFKAFLIEARLTSYKGFDLYTDVVQTYFRIMAARIMPPMEKRPCSCAEARAVSQEQAADETIWFNPVYATEEYLMAALRRLHKAVEGEGLS